MKISANNLCDALCDSSPGIVVDVLLVVGEDIVGESIIVKETKHETGKLVRIVIVEKQTCGIFGMFG